jgi:transcription initiation factor TFIIE subunit alpha
LYRRRGARELSELNKDGNENNNEALEYFFKLLEKIAVRRNLDPALTIEVVKRLMSSSDSKGLSDENLEEMIGVKQNEIRKVLRTLYELRIATYRRGRHPETGSTRYYWTIDPQAINMFILTLKKKILDKMKKKLEFEESMTFYICPVDGTRYTFEEAFDYDFTCPKCGSMLVEYDNTKIKEFLRKKIKELEEEIARDERKLFGSRSI